MLIKQKSPSFPRNLACRTFGELSIVFLTKLNLLYLLYSTAWKCRLLHLIKQSCKISSVVPVFKNVGERSTAKNYHPVSLLSVVSKVFEKLVNNRIVDRLCLEKCVFFLVSRMVLGLFDELQIFLQLCLIELLGLLIGLGLLEL